MFFSSRRIVLICKLLIFAAAIAPCHAQQSNRSEFITAFGNLYLKKVVANETYILEIQSASEPAISLSLQCRVGRRGFTVMLTPPDRRLVGLMDDHQLVTIWADGVSPVDLTFVTYNRDIAVAADFENAPPASVSAASKVFEVLGRASKFFAYSVRQYTATLDLTHLPAARTRFAELCSAPFN